MLNRHFIASFLPVGRKILHDLFSFSLRIVYILIICPKSVTNSLLYTRHLDYAPGQQKKQRGHGEMI